MLKDLPTCWAVILFVIEFKKRKLLKRKMYKKDEEGEDLAKRIKTGSDPKKSKKPTRPSRKKHSSQNPSSKRPSGQFVAPGFTDSYNSNGIEDMEDEKPLLTYPSGKKSSNPEVQLANYAIELLSLNKIRSWAISILINDGMLSLWYYDRSWAICTTPISFKDEREKFILLIIALTQASMSAMAMGYYGSFPNKPDHLKATVEVMETFIATYI
jgi:Fungal protein kinase